MTCKELEKQARKKLGRFSKEPEKAALLYEEAGDCFFREENRDKALECYYNSLHLFCVSLQNSSSPSVIFEEIEDITSKAFKTKTSKSKEVIKKIVADYISALQIIRNYHRDNEELLEEATALEKLGDILLRKKRNGIAAKSYYADAAKIFLTLRGQYLRSRMSPIRIIEIGIRARDLLEKAGRDIQSTERREIEYILETIRQLTLKKKPKRVNQLLDLILKHSFYPEPWTPLHKQMMELLDLIAAEENINSLLVANLKQKIDTSEDERISAEIIRFVANHKDEIKEREIIEHLAQINTIPNLTFEKTSTLIDLLAKRGYFKVEKTSTGRIIKVKSIQEDAVKVLELVKISGEISVPELSQQTGWRPSRSKEVLEQFTEQGIARKVPSYDEGDIYYFPHYWRPSSSKFSRK